MFSCACGKRSDMKVKIRAGDHEVGGSWKGRVKQKESARDKKEHRTAKNITGMRRERNLSSNGERRMG